MDHKKVAEVWDQNAKAWMEASESGLDVWRDHFNTPAFLEMLPDVSQMEGIDIGFGDANNSRLIAKRCKTLVGVDLSQNFLTLVQKQKNPPNLSFRLENAADLSLPDSSFDFAVATMSLMDTAELPQVLSEVCRVLRPDGFFQFSMMHPCFNEHKGQWVLDKNKKRSAFIMQDYFQETTGEIHKWKHFHSSADAPEFKVPRFWRTLSHWLNLISDSGFILDAVAEPYAGEAAIQKYPELASTHIVAHSLMIRVKKKAKDQHSFHTVIDTLPGNVWWKDRNLVYLGCNKSVIKMLGLLSAKEFIGKNDHDLWPKNIADKLREADVHVLQTGATIQLEEVILQNDGSRAIMLTNKSPLRNDAGEIIGIVGTSTDITERKKMEEKLREAKEKADVANLAKTEFLENMRHDIRTPLSGIVGFAELIQVKSSNTEIAEFAGHLVKSSQSLMHYLNEILESILVTSGRVPQLEQKFDLRMKLQDVVDLLLAKADEKKLNLQFFCDENLPQYVVGDPKRLYRITLELLSNAIKFTEQGYVKLFLTLEQKREKSFILRLEVEDSGVGVPPEYQSKIFMRFKKMVPSYRGTHKGLGLGLSIVKEYVKDLEGEIYLENKKEQGSKFICLIPLGIALNQTAEGAVVKN